MSRKGNCPDNSVMENFFGRLKVEMFYGENFERVNAFIERLKAYIYFYNNKRISHKLKMSPGTIPNSILNNLIRFLSKLLGSHHL